MAKILIVENDCSFADALASVLRLAGHEVLVAENADEGVELGLSQQPQIVIADWMLDGNIHGGDVCQRLKTVCPQLRTIIVSGYLDVVAETWKWSDYADAVLSKPFHKKDILNIVNLSLNEDREAFLPQ